MPIGVHFAAANEANQPQLQVINSSGEAMEVFRLDADGGRVSSALVTAGDETSIDTTIGDEFEMVGRKSGARVKVTSKVPVQAVCFDPSGKDGVPGFYRQRVDVMGFPVVASDKVNPYALKEAAYLIGSMLAKRPDVAKAMVDSGARMSIMAHNEFTTDLPLHSRMAGDGDDEGPVPGVSAKDFWDARARGLGGSRTDPVCSCGEENLLCFEGDPYSTENILIHEFAHNIHLRGMLNVDPTFDDRLEAAYQEAMKQGLWKNKYAANNRFEYFAEGVQSWFGNNRENDHDHNHVNTRAELVEYDPVLAGFCKEVFGDTELVYTKPTTRLNGHLEGYDPEQAPEFVWPERLKKAQAEIRRLAREADEA